MTKWSQIERYFPRSSLIVGFCYCKLIRLRRWALFSLRLLDVVSWVRCRLRPSDRRWDILDRRVRVSLTRIIEWQWTTDPVPVQPGSWRMIE